jgi:hypothetical protein
MLKLMTSAWAKGGVETGFDRLERQQHCDAGYHCYCAML